MQLSRGGSSPGWATSRHPAWQLGPSRPDHQRVKVQPVRCKGRQNKSEVDSVKTQTSHRNPIHVECNCQDKRSCPGWASTSSGISACQGPIQPGVEVDRTRAGWTCHRIKTRTSHRNPIMQLSGQGSSPGWATSSGISACQGLIQPGVEVDRTRAGWTIIIKAWTR